MSQPLKPVSDLDIREGNNEIARRVGIDPIANSGKPMSMVYEPLAAKIGLSMEDILSIRTADLLRWLRILDGEALPEDRPADYVLLLNLNPSVGVARAHDVLRRAREDADYLPLVEDFNIPRGLVREWQGVKGVHGEVIRKVMDHVWEVMLGMGASDEMGRLASTSEGREDE